MMRRRLIKILFLFVAFCVVPNVHAYDFGVDGIYYEVLSESERTVAVSLWNYVGDIVVPDTVSYNGTTYTVTAIGLGAFTGCSDLASITLPAGLESIGSSAFYGCNGLLSVTIPDRVTTIGNYAFFGCSDLTTVSLGCGLTSIGRYAFSDCSNLSTIAIPDGVTSIEDNAFSGCSGLVSVALPRGDRKSVV